MFELVESIICDNIYSMRGEMIYKILESLSDGVVNQLDFVQALLKAGYGASGREINNEFLKIKNKRISFRLNEQKIKNLKKYLSKLKSEGLICEDNSRQIFLSEAGKKKLSVFRNSFSLNKNLYQAKLGDRVVVVSYDIPVAFNRERNILRGMLRVLGFHLVHKSVWIGKVALPVRFIKDLNRLGVMEYVEILEVTKSGTLKSIE